MKLCIRGSSWRLLGKLSLVFLCSVQILFAADEAADKTAKGEKNPLESLPWKAGPVTGDLKQRASLKVPGGFRFLGASDAAKLLVMAGNRSNGRELGLVQSVSNRWWAVFEFDDVGYVKDDDKDKLNADKLLATIREGTEEGNKYRAERGIPPMKIVGWHVKPNYNDVTKNLEWSILAESEGRQFVNYNVRILGRKGVTEVTLVDKLDSVEASLPEFRSLLKNFSYTTGESYAEFRAGDKIAKYGLGALVVGGAAAVAYKLGFFGLLLGFFKKFAKLVIVAIAFVIGGIKKLFTGKSRDQAH